MVTGDHCTRVLNLWTIVQFKQNSKNFFVFVTDWDYTSENPHWKTKVNFVDLHLLLLTTRHPSFSFLVCSKIIEGCEGDRRWKVRCLSGSTHWEPIWFFFNKLWWCNVQQWQIGWCVNVKLISKATDY